MKRRVLSLIVAAVMLLAVSVPAAADGEKTEPAVEVSSQAVTVDGRAVSAQVYNIDGSNFFKLRDVAAMLNGTAAQFSVAYDEAARAVTARSGEAYTAIGGELAAGEDRSDTCVVSTQSIAVNGITRQVSVYNIGGSNFFKLRDLGDLLGFGVSYNSETRTVVVDSDDALSFSNAVATVLTPHLDGREIKVTMYEDCYAASPNRLDDQRISIYVPEGADKNSPIIFMVNNGGWRSDAYKDRTQVKSYGTETQTDRSGNTREVTVGDYKSDSDTDAVGRALAEGYVVVSHGARSRGDGLTAGEYMGHSPATMTDTKAAIRYLKYNSEALPAGDTDKIVITGTSGGGALSTVVAASGNSPDYFPSLYEIGAAGIELVDGKYVSTLGDDVFAVIAYCPITDFRGADMAYEWTYGETRERLYAEGAMSYKGADQATVMANSDTLKAAYPAYIESLGLLTEDGKALTAETLREGIIALMNAEIQESVKEIGVEKMRADIAGSTYGDSAWLKLNDDGTYTYDYDEHLYFVAKNTALKIACAFSNAGTGYGEFMNEDNLFGGPENEYSPFEFLSWELDAIAGNGVGKDDTGLTWEEYLATDEGKELSKQIRMTSAVDYLVDSSDGDTAPYWYVRHGMKDRDTSFAVEAVLYYAMINDEAIKDVDFEFAWLQPHSGNYDVNEAYSWLKSIL